MSRDISPDLLKDSISPIGFPPRSSMLQYFNESFLSVEFVERPLQTCWTPARPKRLKSRINVANVRFIPTHRERPSAAAPAWPMALSVSSRYCSVHGAEAALLAVAESRAPSAAAPPSWTCERQIRISFTAVNGASFPATALTRARQPPAPRTVPSPEGTTIICLPRLVFSSFVKSFSNGTKGAIFMSLHSLT